MRRRQVHCRNKSGPGCMQRLEMDVWLPVDIRGFPVHQTIHQTVPEGLGRSKL